MLAKAKLVEVRWTGDPPQSEVVRGGKQVPVQFNPESLKINFANEDNSRGQSSPGQTTGSGTSKLAVELVFDTTTTGTDVRQNTRDIAYFIKPPRDGNRQPAQPGMSFEWGSFIFRGVLKSMDETLDYFSEEGIPLRANISLSVAQPNIEFVPPPAKRGGGGGSGAGQGTGATTPLEAAGANDNVQKVAARNGKSSDWKGVAAANNIDDPLRLPPGQLLNVPPQPSVKRRS